MDQVIVGTIGLLLLVASGAANAVMDKLQFHFNDSIFRVATDKEFWDPSISWRNKWKGGKRKNGEKFLFSSTILVFTTDAWHFFKFIRVNSLIVGSLLIGLGVRDLSVLWMIVCAIVAITIHKITFELFFNKIFSSK